VLEQRFGKLARAALDILGVSTSLASRVDVVATSVTAAEYFGEVSRIPFSRLQSHKMHYALCGGRHSAAAI
jgi:hypothetical protein